MDFLPSQLKSDDMVIVLVCALLLNYCRFTCNVIWWKSFRKCLFNKPDITYPTLQGIIGLLKRISTVAKPVS